MTGCDVVIKGPGQSTEVGLGKNYIVAMRTPIQPLFNQQVGSLLVTSSSPSLLTPDHTESSIQSTDGTFTRAKGSIRNYDNGASAFSTRDDE